MKFCEITAYTNTEYSEIVADIFWDYTVFGVAILDKNDIINMQADKQVYWDYIDESLLKENISQVLVKCYVSVLDCESKKNEIAKRLNKLKETSKDSAGSLKLSSKIIDGDLWLQSWKQNFNPIKIGNVTICHADKDCEKNLGEVAVKIGTNTAFGTGEHETTSMCIEIMQEVLNLGDVVCDIGCGSGILSIAALKLGARRAVLTDIDAISLECAKSNAKLNGLLSKCKFYDDKKDLKNLNADVVFANITAEILIKLSTKIDSAINGCGKLILSGIIDEKIGDVLNCFKSLNYKKIIQKEKGGWNAVCLKKDKNG